MSDHRSSATNRARPESPRDAEHDELPACGSCRKKKLRCSREVPSCTHCIRLGIACSYDAKLKPGLKGGAVEALNQRLIILEKLLLDDNGQPIVTFSSDGTVIGSERSPVSLSRALGYDTYQKRLQHATPEDAGVNGRSQPSSTGDVAASSAPLTRKRKYSNDQQNIEVRRGGTIDNISKIFPLLTDYFCVSFHHWIPFLHKARLQAEARKDTISPNSELVFQAIVVATLRHVPQDVINMTEDEIISQTNLSRDFVLREATSSVSYHGLQALVILVFDYLSDGLSGKAWPLVGLMSRSIDYLQLTVETSAFQSTPLMKPVNIMPPAKDWTEVEERRRLFWNIFLLDRFCSVSTGWNTSLTSEDVKRRLPADGGYFTREEPVTTPYFGIWDKSAAKIGRSLTRVPPQYNEEEQQQQQQPTTNLQDLSPATTNGSALVDPSKLGAFAYCVEATESMSQVVTFFLQQRVDFHNRQDVVDWLTRFKELDLRLVHWKMFLPPKWKDSNISSDGEVVNMDPNLTLAHLIHNTSMILLHYPIAHPPKAWTNLVALPSTCSAETCRLAASETSHIVDKFLRYTTIDFASPQLAFCAFVAAKALLIESQSIKAPPFPAFDYLVNDLWKISAKWKKKKADDPDFPALSRLQNAETLDQAGKYAFYLECLSARCRDNPNFYFDLLNHSCNFDMLRSSDNPFASPIQLTQHRSFSITQRSPAYQADTRSPLNYTSPFQMEMPQPHVQDSLQLTNMQPRRTSSMIEPGIARSRNMSQVNTIASAKPKSNNLLHDNYNHSQIPSNLPPPAILSSIGFQAGQPAQQDGLMDISDFLMNSDFLDMDRVITFNDVNFYAPEQGFGWS